MKQTISIQDVNYSNLKKIESRIAKPVKQEFLRLADERAIVAPTPWIIAAAIEKRSQSPRIQKILQNPLLILQAIQCTIKIAK